MEKRERDGKTARWLDVDRYPGWEEIQKLLNSSCFFVQVGWGGLFYVWLFSVTRVIPDDSTQFSSAAYLTSLISPYICY
jgi:hypothetical protein